MNVRKLMKVSRTVENSRLRDWLF